MTQPVFLLKDECTGFMLFLDRDSTWSHCTDSSKGKEADSHGFHFKGHFKKRFLLPEVNLMVILSTMFG